MTNYIALIIGCILVSLSQSIYVIIPYNLGGVFLVIGIVTMIHAITWEL